ncbi:DUF6443 domain-containing protein [Prevotella dentasini]|uniref:DUF6443 domain-containing protein n=1 Tax=Prevotella dentasini TaxID=589537 RepID=UPI0011DC9A01|nr:hypothetical protein [Prevotella dentasini]
MESQHIYSYIYLTLALLMASGSAKAQEKANYILTKTKIASNSKNIMTYDFFDGLGRETIKATNGIGNGDEFIYSFKEITGEQTMTRNWLPVVGGNTIAIPDVNEINQKASAQYGDSHAYEEYEHDILGRLRKQYKAGHAWKSNPISISYVTNSDNEVIKYKITTAKGIKPDGDRYYKKGTLLGICTIDEDGIKTTTYTDVFGKKILERRGTDNDTYYIYDEFGRIAFVTMPGLKERFILNKNAFQYCEYDISGNLTKKRLPGCYFITYSYDKYNRCTSMQDGELLKKGLYRFMLYDNMGRLAVQGLLTKQPYIDNGLVYYSRGSGGIGGTDYNMLDGTAFRLPIAAIEIVNYYDDYDFLNGASRDLFQNTIQPVSSYAKGRVAGSIVLASNGEKIAVLNSYDQLGNLATIWKRGLDGIVEKTECTYTYTNKIAASSVTVSHTKGASVEFHANNSYNPNNDRLAPSPVGQR